ncbi:MAG: glycosyltransferase family 4 protein, partial [Muribaculaceae bacterium]|nr:glycosyltransferase family 4 protein [Muribaculaceae bacterium]
MNSDSLAKSDTAKTIESLSKLSNLALIKRLYRILKENDIIIMNGYTGKIFRILFLLNLFYRKNIGLDSDTQLNVPANRLKRLLKYIYLGSVFRNKHYWGLPGGTKSHTDLFRYYGMSDDRICLMPMVVNNNRFRMDESRDISKFCFLYVGRVIGVKNIPMMIEAFKKASEEKRNLILRIVGSGNLLDGLKNRYKDCDNIIFAGPKFGDELAEEYRKASAFILPSTYEPWGLVVNEAMASGLPVIVSDKVGAAS